MAGGATPSEGLTSCESAKDGLSDDSEVQRNRPVFNVVEIMFHPFAYLLDGVGFVSPAIDLGPTGDAGLHAMARIVVLDRFLVEQGAGFCPEGMRARSYDRHLAAQHVQELRKLVDAGTAQKAADTGDTRVVAAGELLCINIGFRMMHGAEFHHFDQ